MIRSRLPRLTVTLGLALLCTMPSWSASSKKPEDVVPIESIQQFSKVLEMIHHSYLEEVDDKTLMEYAIRGMLQGLDPHSAFFTPEEFESLKSRASGEFGGIGVQMIRNEDGTIQIIAPTEDSPAEKAGVQPLDIIVRINQSPIKDLSEEDVYKQLRGTPGTDVSISVMRKNSADPIEITITRDIIKEKSIYAHWLPDDIAYIRIPAFQNETDKHFERKLKSMMKEHTMKGLIVDLRNNPGGIYDVGVRVADALLDKKSLKKNDLIVSTKGRYTQANMVEHATPGDILQGRPVVVLINSGSASCSEIVAAAWQDHGRALILGESSFGKGSVQNVIPLDHGYGMKLTSALYYAPSGRTIQALGVEPDITVPAIKTPQPSEERSPWTIKESHLNRHVKNDNPQASTTETLPPEDDKAQALLENYPVYQATQVLKALTSYQRPSS